MKKKILIGNCTLQSKNNTITGNFVTLNKESYYKIENFDQMDSFFMTIVSNSDHWMFISSNGALSAGRRDPDNALFPYYTVDKIQDNSAITGSKTILLIEKNSNTYLWEPFSSNYEGIYKTERNIYKSIYGNKIIFEEINHDLELKFTYEWMNSEIYGFVKQSKITNLSENNCGVEILDGIQNILPAGIDKSLQLSYSNLVDAYKKNELVFGTKIGLFMLSSVIVDKAEPSEALTTNAVWSTGLPDAKVLLSSNQINQFRNGETCTEETDIRATRGAYFVNATLELTPQQEHQWLIVAELNLNAGDVVALKNNINNATDISAAVLANVAKCTEELIKIIAAADGLQLTNDKLSENRHLANVLFNVMRGGIFENNYVIDTADFLDFLNTANKEYAKNYSNIIQTLGNQFDYATLHDLAKNTYNTQLIRLCYEYLPLSFSRRHGDPSRPWNLFSILMKKDNGSKSLNYQGNWRDIFQNWEALSLSFPSFVESMISKFLNASTFDGYNPYRITRSGIDWESPDPHDPWANIGYWGDHQIIYLQKFLEISKKYHPGLLDTMLTDVIFAYANVPYRIKPYQDLVQNPFDTILFDFDAEKIALDRVNQIGSDGKLIWNSENKVLQVTFTEKLLAMLLAKLTNYIPDAGIWLNTQRPEWNDANNALVGNGVSMVTLYHIRRMLDFCIDLYENTANESVTIAIEMETLLNAVHDLFVQFETVLVVGFTEQRRRMMVDLLGQSGSDFRQTVYQNGFSEQQATVKTQKIIDFFKVTLKHIDKTIQNNKRADDLFHSYNLISFQGDALSIRYLYEMLEGQVAVLSAGVLSAKDAIKVLDALKKSAMFREDQYSYMLYPDRQLKRFVDKNNIPAELIENCSLLKKLDSETEQKIFYRDIEGIYHFNGSFRNAADLKLALESVQNKYNFDQQQLHDALNVFEKVFDHQSFTGRSGTFYGFEGLGCIYWHMVSKLLLAISETYFNALGSNEDEVTLGQLIQHYYDVRAGIGFNKSPELFGAFPTDAYSHTPGHGGAKQPGMTGQVKEDIIARFGELGIQIIEGAIVFNPGLLRASEFCDNQQQFEYYSVANSFLKIKLKSYSLAFTYCQVPFIYYLSSENKIEVVDANDAISTYSGNKLNQEVSSEIFNRTGTIKQVTVYLKPKLY